jgi:hypothetical protein
MTGTPREVRTEVCIAGAGCGGVAAAIELLRAGRRVVLIEPTPLVGGQLSSQGVPPDEHRWIEGDGPGAPGFHGATGSYVEFRRRVRAHYRRAESLTPEAHADDRLNPGGGWVSRLCFAPRLADPILRSMLAEATRGGGGALSLLERAEWTAIGSDAEVVGPLHVRTAGGAEVLVHADLFLDATETGDLLELGGVEHAIGAESSRVYGELHGREDLPLGTEHDPLDQQAFTWCFAVDHHAGEDHTIDRPASYDFWRRAIPEMTPAWCGPLFSWTVPSHNEEGCRRFGLVPSPDEPGEWELWRYRRIVDGARHTDGRSDVSLFNVVQMDYWGKPLLGVSAGERDRALAAAREQSLCFLHWMQTEAPRHDDKGLGYPGLRLRGDALGSPDGLALAPYIREPRRLLARTMLTERHVGTQQRADLPGQDGSPDGVGEQFEDSVAVGHYPIDLHPSCAGRNSVYVPACPFRVPLGALVPVRATNLLAAGKCLGVSHVANGSTRLHPVEWGSVPPRAWPPRNAWTVASRRSPCTTPGPRGTTCAAACTPRIARRRGHGSPDQPRSASSVTIPCAGTWTVVVPLECLTGNSHARSIASVLMTPRTGRFQSTETSPATPRVSIRRTTRLEGSSQAGLIAETSIRCPAASRTEIGAQCSSRPHSTGTGGLFNASACRSASAVRQSPA